MSTKPSIVDAPKAEKGNSLSQWLRRKPESEIKRSSEVRLTDRKLRIYNDVMDDYLMLITPDEAKTKEIKNAVRAAVAKLSNNPFIHELEAVAKDISERYPEDVLFDLPQIKNYKSDEKWDTSAHYELENAEEKINRLRKNIMG